MRKHEKIYNSGNQIWIQKQEKIYNSVNHIWIQKLSFDIWRKKWKECRSKCLNKLCKNIYTKSQVNVPQTFIVACIYLKASQKKSCKCNNGDWGWGDRGYKLLAGLIDEARLLHCSCQPFSAKPLSQRIVVWKCHFPQQFVNSFFHASVLRLFRSHLNVFHFPGRKIVKLHRIELSCCSCTIKVIYVPPLTRKQCY